MSSAEGRIPEGDGRESGAAEAASSDTAERSPASVIGLAKGPGVRRFTVQAPYDQRQCIVVVPDQVISIEHTALEGLKRRADADDRAEAMLRALEESMAPGDQPSHGLEVALRGVMRARAAGLEIELVGAGDAAAQISWAPGHPFEGVVYVGHPGVPEIYYAIGEFHQRVFEHKFCEAIDLLMSLGARSVRVERREGFGSAEAGAMNLAFKRRDPESDPNKPPTAQPKHLFEADFPGSSNPQMPSDSVWLDSERSWQTLATARIRHNTEAFSLTVRYENDYGISSAMVAKLEAAGLGTGGRFHEQSDTVWEVEATFPPSAKGEKADAPSLFG